MSDVLTLILAVVAACGAGTVTSLATRPKIKSEAHQAQALGDVAISGDAREWAKEFAARATRAEERAEAAEGRADEAERSANDTAQRCHDLEIRFEVAIRYIKGLREELVAAGGHPAPVPPSLIPPLTYED